ncbi:MAG: hypothetical protein AB1442_00585 [Nitrospirota bacterium]
MEKDKKNRDAKSAYEKPQLNIVELAAEEVLAIGCKMPTGLPNVGQPSCGISARCSTQGS